MPTDDSKQCPNYEATRVTLGSFAPRHQALLTLPLQWLQFLLLLFFSLASGPPSWQEHAQSLAPSGHSAS